MARRNQLFSLAGAVFLHLCACDTGSVRQPGGGTGGEEETGGAGGASTGGSGNTAGKGGSTGTGGASAATGGTSGTGGASGGSGGGGGMAGRDAGSSMPIPDAGARPDLLPPSGDGGPPINAEVEQLCTPMVTLNNMFPNTTGGMRFTRFVPDAQATMQMLSRSVCRYIFRKPEDVRRNARITVVIDNHDGVANAGGGTIHFSANYIGGIGGGDAAISFEIHGVLGHEVTHLWQYNNGGGALVEAMADYSRFRVGFDKLSRRRPGGSYNDPYTTGGFFIVWVEDKYDKDWGYKVNMGMKERGFNYANFIQQTFGKSADALWAEYQAAIR